MISYKHVEQLQRKSKSFALAIEAIDEKVTSDRQMKRKEMSQNDDDEKKVGCSKAMFGSRKSEPVEFKELTSLI